MTDPVDPFRAPGSWLRAALHAHTTNSDGELPPWALAAHYAAAGYDVLATTDHWIRTEIPEDEARGLVVVPSVELNARLPGRARRSSPVLRRRPRARGAHAVREPGRRRAVRRGGRRRAVSRAPVLDGRRVRVARRRGPARDSRSGTAAASARSRVAAPSRTGTTRCSAAATCSAWPPTTPTTRATTATWRGRGFARSSERPRRCSTRFARAPSTPPPGPRSTMSCVDDDAVEVVTSPCRSVTLSQGVQRGSSAQAGRLGYRYHARVLETAADGGLVAGSAQQARRAVRARAGRGRRRASRLDESALARQPEP